MGCNVQNDLLWQWSHQCLFLPRTDEGRWWCGWHGPCATTARCQDKFMLPAAQSTKHLYDLQPFFAAGSSVPMSAGDSLLLVEFIVMTIIFGCHVSPRLHFFAILTLIGRGECLWWKICHCVASVGILCLTLHFSVDSFFLDYLAVWVEDAVEVSWWPYISMKFVKVWNLSC